MTAHAESPTAVGDGRESDIEPETRDGLQPDRAAAEPAVSHRAAATLLGVAVSVPVVLFAWRAMHAPINFDGGMNLQVARRLAEGDGYTRFYGELWVFPREVQTNGPYMYLAALAIKVFGAGQFAYQFANLVFIAAVGVIVSLVLWRESALVRLVGPFVALLAVPWIPLYGLGGLGEIPTSFFLFAAVLALVQAVRSVERSPWWVLVAFVAFGAAFATKTFAVGATATMAVGLVCVLLAVPTRRLRWQVVLATGGAVVVVLAREVHRLLSLGSLDDYREWWVDQGDSISAQSGFLEADAGNPLRTFLDHMHILSGLVDYPAELLLVVLFLPPAWVGALVLWRCRQQGVRRTLSDPATVLLFLLASVAVAYISWWMILLPDNKLWIRRMIPGLLALNLLYLFLVPWLVRAVQAGRRRRRAGGTSASARWVPVAAPVATLVAVGLVVAPYGWDQLDGNSRAMVDAPAQEAWLDATRDAAAYIQENSDKRYHGDAWWSAPVVSLTSGTDFYNLSETDLCALDPARDRLVWDHDAKTIRSRDPWTRGDKLVFEEVASFAEFVTIYSVEPSPGWCD